MSNLAFASTAALERALDGSEDAYQRYFRSMYHCSPDEGNDLNARRESLRKQYPSKVMAAGSRFVLIGEAAFQIASAYYQALAAGSTSEEMREYASRYHEVIVHKHRTSQALPVPIDLTEGQLLSDPELEFFACLAISNGQVFEKAK